MNTLKKALILAASGIAAALIGGVPVALANGPTSAVEDKLERLDIEPTERTTSAEECNFLHSKIFFGAGVASLELHDFPVLDALAECFSDLAPEKVAVVGYTDTEGSWESNQALARDRAEAVIDYLVSAGVPSSMFMPVAVGEATASDTDGYSDARDRRAELWILE